MVVQQANVQFEHWTNTANLLSCLKISWTQLSHCEFAIRFYTGLFTVCSWLAGLCWGRSSQAVLPSWGVGCGFPDPATDNQEKLFAELWLLNLNKNWINLLCRKDLFVTLLTSRSCIAKGSAHIAQAFWQCSPTSKAVTLCLPTERTFFLAVHLSIFLW